MPRVLIVDDEPAVTTMLRRFLERTGRFEVRAENQSREALRSALDFKPDVVVLDVCMPGMDGPEVASRLESLPGFENTPVLFLTGLATAEEIGPGGCRSGSRVYLPKPVRLEDFLRRLDRACA